MADESLQEPSMQESILQEINRLYPDKAFLTLEEIAQFLNCERRVIYNWGKRADPEKRPPRLLVGKEIRFPKNDLVRWLVQELG